MPWEFRAPNALIVEGKEEKRFFDALLRHMGAEGTEIIPMEGKPKLRRLLKALKISPGFFQVRSLGIVVDANSNPRGAFDSVRDALRDAGLPVPEHPLEWTGQDPRLAVLLLPDQASPGMLEDLCLRSVETEPAMKCVEEYFACLGRAGLPESREPSKARVAVFLASLRDAPRRLGEAAEAGDWPLASPVFDDAKAFLRGLTASAAS